MLIEQNGYNGMYYDWTNWITKNSKDSYKYSEKLGKLGAKIQSLSDKITNLKDVKLEVTEKSLENNDKTFTLKVVGNLNLNNKGFIKEIAEQFASILDNYKTKKIEELSKELDSTIEDMKNVFPSQVTVYGSSSSNGVLSSTPPSGNDPNRWKTQICSSFANKVDNDIRYNMLNESDNDKIKTAINWKIE